MKPSIGAGHTRFFLLMLAVVPVLTSCQGSKTTLVVPNPSAPTGLPAPAAPGPANTYTGGQSPGAWTFSLDNSKNTFSYQAVTYPTPATSGVIQTSGGFSSLGSSGLAYEVVGRAAVLRPGDSTASPVFAVPQTQCYAIGGKMRFQYIAMFPGGAVNGGPDTTYTAPLLGYGSVVASTDSSGKEWSFENLQGGAWPSPAAGSGNPPGNIVAGPDSFTGQCGTVKGQTTIALSGTSVLNNFWAPNQLFTPIPTTAQSNIWIGPSGFFAADQSDPSQNTPTGASVAGMAQPTSPLSTSAVTGGQYLGVLYEAGNNPQNYGNSAPASSALTVPVGFGQVVPGGATTLVGGMFPNGVTGPPNTDTVINLGKQDPTLNGLYPAALITVLDPAQNCANFAYFSLSGVVTSGLDAQGYINCTFPAVAVAGNLDGKFAIFVNSYNWAVQYGGVPMQFYLFQQ
jgi:hypothetical protein